MPPIKHRIAKQTMGEREIGTVELVISKDLSDFGRLRAISENFERTTVSPENSTVVQFLRKIFGNKKL